MRKSDTVAGLRVSLVRDGAVPFPDTVADRPAIVAHLVAQFIPSGDEREHFVAVYVDSRSKIKGVSVVSIGTLSASLVHPREVFRAAIVAGAAGVIVAHNHPSGDVTASAEDCEATRRLRKAGELLGIPLLDHVIIAGDGSYTSFKEGGLL